MVRPPSTILLALFLAACSTSEDTKEDAALLETADDTTIAEESSDEATDMGDDHGMEDDHDMGDDHDAEDDHDASDDHDDHDDDMGDHDDAGDPSLHTYEDGIVLTTADGHFDVALTMSDATVMGTKSLRFDVAHLDQPVTDLDIELGAWMPAHGHGTNTVDVVEQDTDGQYLADGLYISMPGLWILTVDLDDGSTPTPRSVSFAFEFTR